MPRPIPFNIKQAIRGAGGSGGGATDLSYTASTRTLSSSTGLDVILPLVAGDPGLMTTADKDKLDLIAAGATANATDAALRDRGTHTGTQASTTISDFTEAAQDATGAMVDASLTYVDGTPLLQRAALTGDVTATAGSNSTTIANDVVTYAKMQNAASAGFIGATGAGDYAHRTPTEVTAALDLATTSVKGLGPTRSGVSTEYLSGTGVYSTPAGGSGALNDLTDVTVSGAAQGQVLARDASDFKNLTVLTFDLGPFYINDLAGSATTDATQAFFTAATAVARSANEIKMEKAGRVVGLWVTTDNARTAGTATVAVEVNNGSQAFNGGAVVLDATNTLSDSSFVAYGSGVAFAAGDTLGAEVTTSGWTPTTADLTVGMVVMLAPF